MGLETLGSQGQLQSFLASVSCSKKPRTELQVKSACQLLKSRALCAKCSFSHHLEIRLAILTRDYEAGFGISSQNTVEPFTASVTLMTLLILGVQ